MSDEERGVRMSGPLHPGEKLNRDLPATFGPGFGHAAEVLGVSPVALSRVVHAHEPLTADLAEALEQAGVGTAESWLARQAAYDKAVGS